MIFFLKYSISYLFKKEYDENELKELILHEFKVHKIKSITLYLPKLPNEEKILIFRNLNKIIVRIHDQGREFIFKK
jgi:hypothetical protein